MERLLVEVRNGQGQDDEAGTGDMTNPGKTTKEMYTGSTTFV